MLNIPKGLKKPERKDYKVSTYDVERNDAAKQKLKNEQYERKKENDNTSCLITSILTWIVAYFIFSIFSNEEHNQVVVILVCTVIAVFIGPFIGSLLFSATEKAVDTVTYKPRLEPTPNQCSTRAYDNALAEYNKTIDILSRRYPDIKNVNYDADKYTAYVTKELANLINTQFDRENIKWWKGQSLNFKSCVQILLKKIGYDNIKRTDNILDPVDASRSHTYDLSASRNGESLIVRCFHQCNGELTVEHLQVLFDAMDDFDCCIAVLATSYRLEEIPNIVKEYATNKSIELWDVNKLIEMTKQIIADNDSETQISLPEGFIRKQSYNISRNLNDSLLTVKPYHYYILSNELFESSKDALTKVSTYPQESVYYGICEYPRSWQYRGGHCVYGIIACSAKNGIVFRMAKECEYMFDAEKRDFINNNHNDSLGNRSKYNPGRY